MAFSDFSTRARMVSRGEQRGEDGRHRGRADVLVAGGRGLGRAEGFELCDELAAGVRARRARSPRRAPSSTPAGSPTPARSARPARRSRRSSTSPPGSPGRSSTRSAWQASENIVAINKDAERADLRVRRPRHRRRPQQDPAQARGGDPRAPGGRLSGEHGAGGGRSCRRTTRRRSTRAASSSAASSTAPTTGSRSASRSSAAAPPGSPCANRLLALLADDPRDRGAPRRGAGRGHREGEGLRRAQPVGRGDAPRAAAATCSRTSTREQWRRGGLRVRRGDAGRRSTCSPTGARSCGSRRRRRFATTATRSSRSRRSARFQQARAEEAGAYVLTETAARAADRRRRARRRRALRRQGARQATASRSRNFEPGTDIARAGDGARRGRVGASDRRGDPRVRARRRPRAAGLGAGRQGGLARPEAARPRDPHARPVAAEAERRATARSAARWIYPMRDERTGEDLVSIGFVIDLEYADATTSAHDLLQLFKQHPLVRGHPRRRRARRLGREGAPRRRLVVDAAPGRCPAR